MSKDRLTATTKGPVRRAVTIVGLVAAALALIATIAVAGGVAATAIGGTDPTPRISSDSSPEARAADHFAVLRQAVAGGTMETVGDEQRVAVNHDAIGDLIVIDRPGKICLGMTADDGVSASACSSTVDALRGLPPQLTFAQHGRVQSYIMIPDGTQAATVSTVDGERREVAVRDNLAILGPDAASVTWTDAEGRPMTVRLGNLPAKAISGK